MKSYSIYTKQQLKTIEPIKRCCSRIQKDIESIQYIEDDDNRINILNNSKKYFKCEHCVSTFLRTLFVCFGNVTDPSKQYHLEFSFSTQQECEIVKDILAENGIDMSITKRKNKNILYAKSSSKIEDFFVLIGANSSLFELMNSKIVKEMRVETNRQINCDIANIRRSLDSSKKYIDAINHLKENGKFIRLNDDLKQTADLRLTNSGVSLKDLGLLHNPPISKSSVKHRLDKIIEISFEED